MLSCVEHKKSFIISGPGVNVTKELSVRVLDLRSKGLWFETPWRHCDLSLSKTLYPCLVNVLIQPRKRPNMTEKVLTWT